MSKKEKAKFDELSEFELQEALTTFFKLNDKFGKPDKQGKYRECPNCGFYSLVLLPLTQRVFCKICDAELEVNLIDE